LELPAVVPAKALYRLLLEYGRPQRTDGKAPAASRARAVADWLDDPDLVDAAVDVFVGAHRAAQEHVGVELLSTVALPEL
jgi:hypothetical protein